ncbi:TetR/AcrR family transcriptional regulator [Phytomonospora endophytica]|uniref:AcrR family transcriptional regulator n=1 Tax=Phytomonospora endophytica TaxID=714109 RepID=A0A841FF35_9ACTN|nr:TetR family transcriptional regulator [Phytomonospora endophytica]MBB6034185.1 AcrR family transcriptional regulator [Phytomonospora endophytica]GIG66577.1 TetR family transcriptional regulator [Phytomonospora endophytica]
MSPAEALLDRCVEYLRANGFRDHSLRQMAAAVGTSHRMLIYHFGSREGLLAEVVARVEAEQRAALASLKDQIDPVEASRAFWRGITAPGLAPAERLFFEVYALALHSPGWSTDFAKTVIDAWLTPLTELLVAHGVPEAAATARARLAIATARGLLLDLLLTGDRDGVEAAAEAFQGMLFGDR